MGAAGGLRNLSDAERAERLAAATDSSVRLPAYYHRPFHAYDDGNLGWDAALEVELASKAVNAVALDAARKEALPDGDARLRATYHAAATALIAEAGGWDTPARRAVDLGCACGLSSVALALAEPHAHVLGAPFRAGHVTHRDSPLACILKAPWLGCSWR